MDIQDKSYSRKKKISKSRKRFWVSLIIISLLLVLLALLYPSGRTITPYRYVTVGTCGCVKNNAIYRLPEGADVAMLIEAAGGLTEKAYASEIEYDMALENDRVYSIPCRGEGSVSGYLSKPDTILRFAETAPEEEVVTILYIGFPAVYFLIRYWVSHGIINVIYIPHSTVFMANEYRIIDLYFTLGIEPTVKILENALSRKIDYYYIQNKTSFIDMIDELGGLSLNIDALFARDYRLKEGRNDLNGWYTYEYIRYIDRNTYSSAGGTNSMEDLKLELHNAELAYDLRQQRQKKVINALHVRIQEQLLSGNNVQDLIRSTLDFGTVDANLDATVALKLFRNLMEGTVINFGTLPGYYKKTGENIFYIPFPPGSDMLENEIIREMTGADSTDTRQILY